MSASRVIDALRAALERELADPSTRFVGAYSGGLDSSVLLGFLVDLVDAGRVRAVHVDHRLHPHSALWARQCAIVGEALGVRVTILVVDVARGGNREDAARRARYEALAAELAPGEVLLLGHHADDQAETLLHRLMVGRFPRGMPRTRRLGAGRLSRPMLDVERRDIENAAKEVGFTWVDDPSNADRGFDRNFLRHEILPRLRDRWPDITDRLAHQSNRIAAVGDLGRDALDRELAALPSRALPLPNLAAAPQPMLLLRRWLERAGAFAVADRCLRVLLASSVGAPVRVQISADFEVRSFDDKLHIVVVGGRDFARRRWDLRQPLELPRARLAAVWHGAGTPDAVTVDVCARVGGERLHPIGRGGSRSVKRLLAEARVLPWLRAAYPLVYHEERLALVPGVAVDEAMGQRFATACGPETPNAGRWLIRIEF